jgi:hypothetical protein
VSTPSRRRTGPRSLVGYLLLPRPGDLGKAVILPLGFAVGVLITTAPDAAVLLRAALVWFAVEYLAYQARYQWNDIRGFRSDQQHPDSDERGRLPGPLERGPAHIRISAAVALLRVAGAGLLALVLAQPAVLLVSVAAVFVVAAVYESVRSRAGTCCIASSPAPACVLLWFVAGGGYCVRGLTGLVLATGGRLSPSALVFAGVACWAAGMLFVTTRWAVESIPFARRAGGRLEWSAPADAGRGHLLALSGWLPHDGRTAPADLRRWRPLWGTSSEGDARQSSARTAPWNLALIIALAAAWLLGFGVAGAGRGGGPLVVSVLAVVVAWNMLVSRPEWRSGVLAAALMIAGAHVAGGTLALAVPPLIVVALFLMCVHQNLDDVGTLVQRRVRPLVDAVDRASRSTTRQVGGALEPVVRP